MGVKTALPFFAIAAVGVYWMHITLFGANASLMAPSSSVRLEYRGYSEGLQTFVTFGRACFGKRSTQLVLTTFGAALPAFIAISLLESCRRVNPTIITFAPTLFLLASQALTTGVVVPLWFGLLALYAPKKPAKSLDDEKEARSIGALVPAFLLGYVLPTTGTLLQSHFSRFLSSKQLDLLNVSWQVYPISIALISFVFRSVSGPPQAPSRTARRAATVLLLLAGVFSTVWHYYFLYSVIAESPSLAPKSYFGFKVPQASCSTDVQTAYAAFQNVFKFGPVKLSNLNDLAHVFLSIDAVLTILPILLFAAAYPSASTTEGEDFTEGIFRTVVVSAVVSPGAACALAYWKGQESRRLEEKRAVREKKGK